MPIGKPDGAVDFPSPPCYKRCRLLNLDRLHRIPLATEPVNFAHTGQLAMTSENWPLNKLTDDCVPVVDGGVRLGHLIASNLNGLLNQFGDGTCNIAVAVTDDLDLWSKLPPKIKLLASGAMKSSGLFIMVEDFPTFALRNMLSHTKKLLLMERDESFVHQQRSTLGPGIPEIPAWLIGLIRTAADSLPGGTAERTAVAAGLHLLYDDLDGSHALSQTIEGCGKNHNGDYWHAIMHRREPDYGNAKYWFRRVGTHPVLAELPAVLDRVRTEAVSSELDRWAVRLVKNGTWDPFAFVDACETASRPDADRDFVRALEEIQHCEMLQVLVQSCADAQAK